MVFLSEDNIKSVITFFPMLLLVLNLLDFSNVLMHINIISEKQLGIPT